MEQLDLTFSLQFTQGAIKTFYAETKAEKNGPAGTSSGEGWSTAIDNFEVWPGLNPRDKDAKYEQAVENLYQSMLAHGWAKGSQLGCIVVKGEDGKQHLLVWDGHRRLDAARRVIKFIEDGGDVQKHVAKSFEKKTLPFFQMPEGTTPEDVIVAMVRANTVEPFSPLGLAVQCKRLADRGHPTEWIANQLVISTQYVRNLLKLISAPQEIIQMIRSGQVSETLVVQMLRDHGDDALEKLQAGLTLARQSGKDRVTRKVMAAGQFKSELKKEAPVVFLAMRDVRNDPAYMQLSKEVRDKLEGVFERLDPLDGRDAVLEAAAKKGEPKQPKASKTPKPPKQVKQPKAPTTRKLASQPKEELSDEFPITRCPPEETA